MTRLSPLSPGDLNRLAGVLGLLGSPHIGERDAAALAADRIVRGRGLSWTQVLAPATVELGQSYQRPSPAPVNDLQTVGRRPDLLNAWERAFVADLAMRRVFSAKQTRILAELAARVRAAGPRGT